MEEAEPEDSKLSSLMTGVEVTEAVPQLHSRGAPGVDEIGLELLKAFDVNGLS